METKIDYEHHLLQSRPNFAKALKDFETFLLATTEDLQNKFRVLESQKSHRKTSRNLKTYLSLQNYLLNKHLTRLHEFQNEIYARVAIVFAQEDLKQNGADEQFLSVKYVQFFSRKRRKNMSVGPKEFFLVFSWYQRILRLGRIRIMKYLFHLIL